MSAGEQARAFLTMMLCGMCGGAAYDGLMLLRRMLHAGVAVTGILDLAFGALLAVMMTLTGLLLETDPFRLYAFAGVGLGLIAWFASAGALLRQGMRLAAKIVTKTAKIAKKR